MAGQREVISIRVSRETAEAIDAARGPDSRARWVASVIETALVPRDATETTAPKVLAAAKGETVPCSHPRARVIKGFCYRCGRMVPQK